MLKEVQETVNSDFRTLEEAFNYFSNKSKYITFSLFEYALKTLFPDRFHNSDIVSLWFKLVDSNTRMIDY
jgi:hypothetical protein